MNREQKSVAIAEIATQIDESHAIFAVDYRGISVGQAAELRSNLREADALFKVVKNSLTERAADQVGAEALKAYLSGPTALTFVRGDIAVAAKALADYGRATQLLPVKGGLMDGEVLDPEQIRVLSRLPSREALYGQLVGVVASPVSGLVRTLNALISGLAVALGGVREKKESGEIPAGEPPAAAEPAEQGAGEAGAPAEEAAPEAASPGEAPAEPPAEEATAEAPDAGEGEPPAEAAAGQATEPEAESEAESDEAAPAAEPEQAAPAAEAEAPAAEETPESEAQAADEQAEPAKDEPAQEDDNQADAAAEVQSEDAEAKPTKED